MPTHEPNRKRVKHHDQTAEIHELTFSCYLGLPLLDDCWRREQLTIAINRALDRHEWRLAAFVYMPEHIHLLTYPTKPAAKVSKLLFAIKRPFSYRVKQQLLATNNPLLAKVTIQQRPGKQTFRFWQEGPGYDRNIRSEKVLRASIDYIHLNPVKRSLCQTATEYRWSSAQWYASDGENTDTKLPKLTAIPAEWFAGISDATSY